MPRFQILRFSGEAPPDKEFEHPHGASIARLIQSGLKRRGWVVGDLETHDREWSIMCSKETSQLEVSLAEDKEEKAEWILLILPTPAPGLWSILFRKKPLGTPMDCFEVAKHIHDILAVDKRYSNFKWCWDGIPEDGNSTAWPTEP